MASKLVNFIALATLAILASSYGPSQASALSVESHNFVRHNARHHLLARQQENKTTTRRRCKARPSSSLVASSAAASSSSAQAAPPKASPSSSKAAPQQAVETPKASPNPNPAPAPSNPGNRKAGIAWNNPNPGELLNLLTPKVSAVYTWSPTKLSILNGRNDVEFISMIWGDKQVAEAKRVLTRGYGRTVLGFNEPDQAQQANMSPQYAAQVWRDNVQPLKSLGYTLVSPAPTNAPSGTKWLQDFFGACNGCTIDAVACHWYGTSSQNFIDHVTNYNNIFQRPVWVTEFACQNFGPGAQCSVDQVWQFMKTVTGWMDRTDFVAKYFAFGFLHDMYNVNPANQLLGNDGQPTPLGREYLA